MGLIKKQTELDSDMLVIGGGTAGCLAAMAAREQGARVVVVEKGGSISRSGSCASGMDHSLFSVRALGIRRRRTWNHCLTQDRV